MLEIKLQTMRALVHNGTQEIRLISFFIANCKRHSNRLHEVERNDIFLRVRMAAVRPSQQLLVHAAHLHQHKSYCS